MNRDVMWALVIVVVAAVGMGLVAWNDKRARDLVVCQQNLKSLGTALEMYSTSNGGRFPLDLERGNGVWVTPLRFPQAIVPGYLKEMPTCPAAGTDTYSKSSWGTWAPDTYTLVCGGRHHEGAGRGTNYPQYTSTLGLVQQ